MTIVLTALCSLLGNPNCDDDALRPEVVQEFLKDRYQFDIKARLLTQRFASRDYHNGSISEFHPESSANQTEREIQRSTAIEPTNWLTNIRRRSLDMISGLDVSRLLLFIALFLISTALQHANLLINFRGRPYRSDIFFVETGKTSWLQYLPHVSC